MAGLAASRSFPQTILSVKEDYTKVINFANQKRRTPGGCPRVQVQGRRGRHRGG